MALTPDIQDALTHLAKAQEIVQRHLLVPIQATAPRDVRAEMLARLQAVDHVAEAELWVKRLDPTFGRALRSLRPFRGLEFA